MRRPPILVRLTAAFATATLLMLASAEGFVYLRLRADLDDLMALQDLRRRILEMLMEVVEKLAGAPRAVLGIGLPVVPRDAARLPLHVRTRHVRRDAPE